VGCYHCLEFVIAESVFLSPRVFHLLITGSIDIRVFIIAGQIIAGNLLPRRVYHHGGNCSSPGFFSFFDRGEY